MKKATASKFLYHFYCFNCGIDFIVEKVEKGASTSRLQEKNLRGGVHQMGAMKWAHLLLKTIMFLDFFSPFTTVFLFLLFHFHYF